MAAFNGREFAVRRGKDKKYAMKAADDTKVTLTGWAKSLTPEGFRTLGLSQIEGAKGSLAKDVFDGGQGKGTFVLTPEDAAAFAYGVCTGEVLEDAQPAKTPAARNGTPAKTPASV